MAAPQPDAQPGSQATVATEPQSLPGAPAEPVAHVKVRILHDSASVMKLRVLTA